MITRKLWSGDGLVLAVGNSFYGRDEVVTHRAGIAIVIQDCEEGDPLVEVNGGYIVKREDLSEFNLVQLEAARLTMQLSIPEALNGIDGAERVGMAQRLGEIAADAFGGL